MENFWSKFTNYEKTRNFPSLFRLVLFWNLTVGNNCLRRETKWTPFIVVWQCLTRESAVWTSESLVIVPLKKNDCEGRGNGLHISSTRWSIWGLQYSMETRRTSVFKKQIEKKNLGPFSYSFTKQDGFQTRESLTATLFTDVSSLF